MIRGAAQGFRETASALVCSNLKSQVAELPASHSTYTDHFRSMRLAINFLPVSSPVDTPSAVLAPFLPIESTPSALAFQPPGLGALFTHT